MTSTQTLIDQELAHFGWIESVATNSISDFKSPKSTTSRETIDEKKSDPIDICICHFIFYVIFCYSLFLYVVIDLGFGSFLKTKITTLMKFDQETEITSLDPTSRTKSH